MKTYEPVLIYRSDEEKQLYLAAIEAAKREIQILKDFGDIDTYNSCFAKRYQALDELTLKNKDLIVLKVRKGISLEDVLQNGCKYKRHLLGKTHYYRLRIDSAYEDIANDPQKCPELILRECDRNGKVFGMIRYNVFELIDKLNTDKNGNSIYGDMLREALINNYKRSIDNCGGRTIEADKLADAVFNYLIDMGSCFTVLGDEMHHDFSARFLGTQVC